MSDPRKLIMTSAFLTCVVFLTGVGCLDDFAIKRGNLDILELGAVTCVRLYPTSEAVQYGWGCYPTEMTKNE